MVDDEEKRNPEYESDRCACKESRSRAERVPAGSDVESLRSFAIWIVVTNCGLVSELPSVIPEAGR
jgi:hypothetical protein